MTDINTLKKWFTTGSKPTQEQFWATFDCFYHKDEQIAMSNVEGLDTALSFKAEAKTLASYARLDASNLKDADVTIWKMKLGVGTLPANIATYDPAKVNYVMMKDGTDKPAGDLGKNMANSALTTVAGAGITQGANYTWSTAGYYLYLTGTPEKSRDQTFNRMMVQDANGQVAWSNGTPIIAKAGSMLPDVSGNGNYNKMLVSDADGNTGLGDATNIVSSLQSATQAEINTLFNILGGNYKGISSPVVNAIFPPAYALIDGITQEIVLYGVGLSILNDPLIASVKILDVSTNAYYSVGYNSVNGNALKIYIPSHIVQIGKEYKIQITTGVLNYQSTLSFSVIDGSQFNEVIIRDSDWTFTELQSGSVTNNGKFSLNNGIFTAPPKPASPINYGSIESVYTVDLSSKISNIDNFSIELETLNGFIAYNDSDAIKVGFKDVATPHTAERYTGLMYGYVNADGASIINNTTGNFNTPYTFTNGSSVVNKIFITRLSGRVTIAIVNIQGSTLYSISSSLIPAPGIQNLMLVFGYKLYKFDSQLKIKKLIKWQP